MINKEIYIEEFKKFSKKPTLSRTEFANPYLRRFKIDSYNKFLTYFPYKKLSRIYENLYTFDLAKSFIEQAIAFNIDKSTVAAYNKILKRINNKILKF